MYGKISIPLDFLMALKVIRTVFMCTIFVFIGTSSIALSDIGQGHNPQ